MKDLPRNGPSWSQVLSEQADFQESQKVMRDLSVRAGCEFLMREVWRTAWLAGFRAATSGAGEEDINAVRSA